MLEGYTVTLMFPEEVILDTLSKRCNRNTIALLYAFAIVGDQPIDWKKVNEAVIAKWSPSALKYVKEKAWRMVREKQQLTNQPNGA